MPTDDIELTPIRPRSAGAAPPPPPVYIQQPPSAFGRYGKWLLAALALAVMVIIGLYGRYHSYFSPADAPREKYHSLARYAPKKIAIIDISGPIMDGDGFVKKQIDRVRDDTSVVAVVVRIDSPGGTVTASDYIYHHLRELADDRELPLVVSMGGVCASGGYYVAMAAGPQPDVIFAEPTTWTGSIGVIIPHFDVSGTLGSVGIREDSIASGKFKQTGSPTRRMTEEERELMQSLVDDTFARFKEIVLAGRPALQEDEATLEAVSTGRIFTAGQALEHKLIDKIGFEELAIARAAELAGESVDDLRCVKYEKPPTLMGAMLGAEAGLPQRPGVDLVSLVDLTVPRAYYLWSWLPTTLTNSQ